MRRVLRDGGDAVKVTQAEMESRGRVAGLKSVITDAVATFQERTPDITYVELVLALSETLHRWAAVMHKEDFKT